MTKPIDRRPMSVCIANLRVAIKKASEIFPSNVYRDSAFLFQGRQGGSSVDAACAAPSPNMPRRNPPQPADSMAGHAAATPTIVSNGRESPTIQLATAAVSNDAVSVFCVLSDRSIYPVDGLGRFAPVL